MPMDYKATLQRAAEKFRASAALAAAEGLIPYKSENGRWIPSPYDGNSWWTGGFWPGLMWQFYAATGDEAFLREARRTVELLTAEFRRFTHLNHDVGFMYLLSCGADWKLTGDAQAHTDTLHAASLLMGRFSPVGYIRAWNGFEQRGYAIIDCMMNLSLLFWASRQTKDPRFAKVATIHADTCAREFIRENGSVSHIIEFDSETGARVKEHAGQGYCLGSSWSRGQAWGLYGFTLAHLNTHEPRYLAAAEKIAGYFMAHIRPDGLTDCDFCQPPEEERLDNIAGAVAACGLLELAKLTGNQTYHEAALRLVDGLLPMGEVSLLGADGGTGKGIWQAQLIAYVTAGRTSGFFPQPPEKTGSVLLFSGEDDPGKVLKARLTAAGADMSRVMVVTSDAYFARTGSPLCIPDTGFAKYVGKAAPALVIIDPLQSFLPAGVEMASRNQMRSALLPLKALCARHGCAALISMHTNKRANVSGRARLADSSDIWDIARSVLMMGRDKNSEKLYLSHEKSSYSAPARTALLHIEQAQVEGVKTAVAVFDSRTDKKDADFVEERRVRTAQTKEDTAQAILNVLAESKLGSMPSTQLRAEVMKEMGCSEVTYNRAYSSLVKSGEVTKKNIRQRDGRSQWHSFLYCSRTNDKVPN